VCSPGMLFAIKSPVVGRDVIAASHAEHAWRDNRMALI